MSSLQQPLTVAVLGTAAATGLLVHRAVININVDHHPWSVLGTIVAFYCLVAVGIQQISHNAVPFSESRRLAFWATSCTLLSLYASTLVYRAFFHPLRHFPGPFWARLSKIWTLCQVVKSDSKWYRVCIGLHQKYGDYVRTSPNELVILDPAAIGPILGLRNKKGPFYGATQKSLHTNQDEEFHRKRRRVWDKALKQATADYAPIIEEFTDTLLERLDKSDGKAVNVNEFSMHYAYDVMSSVGFGSATRFIEGKSSDFANTLLAKIQEGITAIAFLGHIPTLLVIAESLTFLGGPLKLFREWSKEQVRRRKVMQNPRPDIMGHLLAETPDDTEGQALLDAESRLIVGAGSDTTGSALVVLFALLAHHQSYQKAIREEIARSFADGTYSCGRPQDSLDALINEALRMAPPVLFNTQRYPPKGGVQIGEVYIPEGTICCIGAYQLHHDERNFLQPHEFIPERWTSRPELVLNKNAFIPFNLGPYMCPGKATAMMEMRSVIAKTVHRYNISFLPGTKFDLQEFLFSIKDRFTSGMPTVKVVFTPRETKE